LLSTEFNPASQQYQFNPPDQRNVRNASGRDLLKRELRNIRTIPRMLDGDAANIALRIPIQQGVFIQIPALAHRRSPLA